MSTDRGAQRQEILELCRHLLNLAAQPGDKQLPCELGEMIVDSVSALRDRLRNFPNSPGREADLRVNMELKSDDDFILCPRQDESDVFVARLRRLVEEVEGRWRLVRSAYHTASEHYFDGCTFDEHGEPFFPPGCENRIEPEFPRGDLSPDEIRRLDTTLTHFDLMGGKKSPRDSQGSGLARWVPEQQARQNGLELTPALGNIQLPGSSHSLELGGKLEASRAVPVPDQLGSSADPAGEGTREYKPGYLGIVLDEGRYTARRAAAGVSIEGGLLRWELLKILEKSGDAWCPVSTLSNAWTRCKLSDSNPPIHKGISELRGRLKLINIDIKVNIGVGHKLIELETQPAAPGRKSLRGRPPARPRRPSKGKGR